MKTEHAPQPPPHERRRIAVAGAVHPRTVEAYFAGRVLRSTTQSRIEAALRSIGRTDLLRPAALAQPQPTRQREAQP